MTSSEFSSIAAEAISALCTAHPEEATFLGDHSHDDQLSYPTAVAAHRRRSELTDLITRLDALDTNDLDTGDLVDREILRTAAAGELFELTDLDEASWNPMQHNPGQALYGLLSRDFAPLPERLAHLAGRVRSIPDYLDAARLRLSDLSPIHTETAIAQLDGTVALLENAVPAALAESSAGPSGDPSENRSSTVGADFDDDLARAITAVREHQNWLRNQLPEATRTARLGEELFTRKLALTLATPWRPRALLEQAFRDLERVDAELSALAGDPNSDRRAIAAEFDRLAADMASSETILDNCRTALTETTEFVQRHGLLTLLHDPVEVIEMPEIDRGVAVAYCRSVGALETAPLQTQFAVSPTPEDWSPERVTSFYREYNNHMLHNLTVHEAMPGHVEQLSHSRRYQGSTAIRSVFGSGSFIEGWAVYAEELMASLGYRGDVSPEAAAAVRMQQLKMQLRMILNTILDISFHTGELDEAGAMALMTERGYQEEGEAAGKWRRVQLSSTQLCTYYVGYLEVRQVVADLRAAHPDWSVRQVHDAVLSFGSPPVRHLRTLLGLPPAA